MNIMVRKCRRGLPFRSFQIQVKTVTGKIQPVGFLKCKRIDEPTCGACGLLHLSCPSCQQTFNAPDDPLAVFICTCLTDIAVRGGKLFYTPPSDGNLRVE